MRNQCIITENSVQVNDQTIFTTESPEDLDSFLLEAYSTLKVNYPKFHKMDRISKLGIITASMVFKDTPNTSEPFSTGIILCSKSGCLHTDGTYIEGLRPENFNPNPTLFTYTLPSIVMGEICIKQNIKGENTYLVLEKFNQPLIDQLISNMFFEKGMDQCLVGWIELESANNYKSHFYLESKVNYQKIIGQKKLQYA